MKDIHGFQGEFRWLSNFWPATVILDGAVYRTVEHAYQAAKTYDAVARKRIAKAASLGKQVTIRFRREDEKLSVMQDLLEQKFSIPELREKLIATGKACIQETNTWGDVFWGVCNGRGHNHLGRLIMEIRAALC